MKVGFRFLFVFFLLVGTLNADLLMLYKTGVIRFSPADSFKSSVDWEELFYDTSNQMVVTKDGHIFVSNLKNHCIYRFNPKGDFLGKFGQRGRGPGYRRLPRQV